MLVGRHRRFSLPVPCLFLAPKVSMAVRKTPVFATHLPPSHHPLAHRRDMTLWLASNSLTVRRLPKPGGLVRCGGSPSRLRYRARASSLQLLETPDPRESSKRPAADFGSWLGLRVAFPARQGLFQAMATMPELASAATILRCLAHDSRNCQSYGWAGYRDCCWTGAVSRGR